MISHPRILFLLGYLWALAGCTALPNTADPGTYRSQEQIAVLLPLSGRYAAAAQAVREGLLAAQAAMPKQNRPQLRFYDTNDPEGVPNLLRRAAAAGAVQAIGPLRKASVQTLTQLPRLPIPTLALNRTDSAHLPEPLYQFALAPEEESQSVAEAAWQAGHRRALILYPKAAWGQRLLQGFRQRWRQLGGQFVGEIPYSSPTGLQILSDRPADFLFLIATADQAQSLVPRLRETRLPLYSTSHVLGDMSRPKPELAGLYVVEIPWLLHPEGNDVLSLEHLRRRTAFNPHYVRLYAMGIDAYQLLPKLPWLEDHPQARFPGKTGNLRIDPQRRIHRQLPLGRINATGKLVPQPR